MNNIELSKSSRLIDLALRMGRSCLSAQTGFLHLFEGEAKGDTIPLYENFCFALALFRQKTVEGVLEGKELLNRLFAFQSLEQNGNFPHYLHEYPSCRNPLQSLRIATVLVKLLRQFKSVLGDEFKCKISEVTQRLLECAKKRHLEKPFEGVWARRLQILLDQKLEDASFVTSVEWGEELINLQLAEFSTATIERFIHPTLQLYIGPCASEGQEAFEPRPCLLEWWSASSSFSPRLTRLHPLQLPLALLEPRDEVTSGGAVCSISHGEWRIKSRNDCVLSYITSIEQENRNALRLCWGEKTIHSLVVATGLNLVQVSENEKGAFVTFTLPEVSEFPRNDLFEVALFCNISSETDLFVKGERSTTFRMGETISIQTPLKTLECSFEVLDGEGDFFGHLHRANRPFQIATKGASLYDAFDWKIVLRTLRREPHCQIGLQISF